MSNTIINGGVNKYNELIYSFWNIFVVLIFRNILLIIPKEVLFAFREIICFYEYNQAIQAAYKCTTAHFAANLSG